MTLASPVEYRVLLCLRGTGQGAQVMKRQGRITAANSATAGRSATGKAPVEFAPLPPTPPVQPNHVLLAAMAQIAEIHKNMNPRQGKDTLDYLREAREGAMYDAGSDR
jgi:hypothetical protein